MIVRGIFRLGAILSMTAFLASCVGQNTSATSTIGGGGGQQRSALDKPEETIWDLFNQNKDPTTTVAVNKYIWQASLEVLDFLPVKTVDPFTGVIATGYGKPPGGNAAYRATVYVQDPALEARALRLILETPRGPVDHKTVTTVERAILTRARALRRADLNF